MRFERNRGGRLTVDRKVSREKVNKGCVDQPRGKRVSRVNRLQFVHVVDASNWMYIPRIRPFFAKLFRDLAVIKSVPLKCLVSPFL